MNTLARGAVVGFVASIPVICWALEVGVALTPSHFFGLALMGIAAVAWWRERRPLARDLAVVSLLAFCLIAAITVVRVQLEPNVSFGGESAHFKSIKQIVGLGFGAGVFLALLHLVRWYGLGRTVWRVHFWTAVAVTLVALAQFAIALVDLDSPWAAFPVHNSTQGSTRPLSRMYGFPRISATLVEPSALGTYLLTAWALWLYSFAPGKEAGKRQWWATASGVLLGAGIILTGSRLAYVIFAALGLGAFVLRPHRLARAAVLAVSVAAGLALTSPAYIQRIVRSVVPATPAPAVPPSPSTRPNTPAPPAPSRAGSARPSAPAAVAPARPPVPAIRRYDVSVQQRAASYVVTLEAIRHRPWLGHGWGTSEFAMERYWPAEFSPLAPDRRRAPVMMTTYGKLATETGVLGLGCFGLFAAAIAGRLGSRWRRACTRERGTIAGAAAIAAAFGIAMVSSAPVVYEILLPWLVAVLAVTGGDDATAVIGPDPPPITHPT